MSKYVPTIGAVVLSLLLMGGFVIVYTGYAQQKGDRRWCALFETLDPPGAPPTTDRGAVVQKRVRELRKDFRCKEG